MTEPAEIGRRDQEAAASRDALIHGKADKARVAGGLRADIAAGRMTRQEAIADLLSRWDLTGFGAADILDNAGVPGRGGFGKTNMWQVRDADLPPLITTEER